MILIPMMALVLWVGWTLLAYSKPKNPRTAAVISTSALLLGVVVALTPWPYSLNEAEFAGLVLGPGLFLSSLRLKQAIRRMKNMESP
ncbi:hypothetical protein [Streptomyces apocyni]|uniref:hypothetical protein n=1 Tax=Streptomyces apocyni TaxID=2654677 RepID=UPI0012E9FCDE|nr:hypothetical protein [Streptomyces apocyni]